MWLFQLTSAVEKESVTTNNSRSIDDFDFVCENWKRIDFVLTSSKENCKEDDDSNNKASFLRRKKRMSMS